MAHYAWLDENNIVINVSVGVDENETIEGLSVEDWCSRSTGYKILRTSYNAKIRKNYAGIGFSYNPDLDAFIPPKCHDEAVLIIDTCQWECENNVHKASLI
jgi:hypothetical protein